MSQMKDRIKSILTGVIMFLLGVGLLSDVKDSYAVVVVVYGLAMAFAGIQRLWYFFTLSRHMVGGRIMLYLGVIDLDFGVFTMTLTEVPRIYVLLYLLGCHLLAGCVDLLRALEARGVGAPMWKLNASYGIVNIGMALACLIFLKSPDTVVYIFSAGLFYSAFVKIVNAFRRTAVIYIP